MQATRVLKRVIFSRKRISRIDYFIGKLIFLSFLLSFGLLILIIRNYITDNENVIGSIAFVISILFLMPGVLLNFLMDIRRLKDIGCKSGVIAFFYMLFWAIITVFLSKISETLQGISCILLYVALFFSPSGSLYKKDNESPRSELGLWNK